MKTFAQDRITTDLEHFFFGRKTFHEHTPKTERWYLFVSKGLNVVATRHESIITEGDKQEQLLLQEYRHGGASTQQKVVITIILFLFMALGFINYIRFRDKRRHAIELANKNKKIDRQYSQLKRTNEQNELLLREIHHRVKNNLQLAASLLNLQIRTTDSPEAIGALRESASRLYSMLLVHQELYGRDQLGAINVSAYVQNLIQYLEQSYSLTDYSVATKIDIDTEIYLNTDTTVPLGLIITELFTNSLKYARPDEPIIYIAINLYALTEKEYKLSYTDNGKGFPQDLDITKEKTMGLRLIRDLTRQLKGTIDSPYQNSSFITITFKDI
ncbi:MAG: sensor histidine kinase [Pseudosphingobacterium sp.]|nr:sensor histidine kinase [Pseudosphingobacterium sp.]